MKGRTRWRHMIRLSGLVVKFLSTLPRGERPASGPLRWLLRMVLPRGEQPRGEQRRL
jgi:hypothetical protein